MSTLPWKTVYENLLNSPTFTLLGGGTIKPRFGDYLDTIAGEVDVFMVIGEDPNPRSFRTTDNDPVPVDINGYMTFVDTNHQTITFLAIPLPPPGKDDCSNTIEP